MADTAQHPAVTETGLHGVGYILASVCTAGFLIGALCMAISGRSGQAAAFLGGFVVGAAALAVLIRGTVVRRRQAALLVAGK